MNEFRSASDLPPDKAEIVEFMGWATIFQIEADKLKRQTPGLKRQALLELVFPAILLMYPLWKLDSANVNIWAGNWPPQVIVLAILLAFIFIVPTFRKMSENLRKADQLNAQATLLLVMRDHILMTNGEPASQLVKQSIGNAIAWIDLNNKTAAQVRDQIEFLTLETAKLSGTKSL